MDKKIELLISLIGGECWKAQTEIKCRLIAIYSFQCVIYSTVIICILEYYDKKSKFLK